MRDKDRGIVKTARRLKLAAKFEGVTVSLSGPGAHFLSDDIERIIRERDASIASAEMWEDTAKQCLLYARISAAVTIVVALSGWIA